MIVSSPAICKGAHHIVTVRGLFACPTNCLALVLFSPRAAVPAGRGRPLDWQSIYKHFVEAPRRYMHTVIGTSDPTLTKTGTAGTEAGRQAHDSPVHPQRTLSHSGTNARAPAHPPAHRLTRQPSRSLVSPPAHLSARPFTYSGAGTPWGSRRTTCAEKHNQS